MRPFVQGTQAAIIDPADEHHARRRPQSCRLEHRPRRPDHDQWHRGQTRIGKGGEDGRDILVRRGRAEDQAIGAGRQAMPVQHASVGGHVQNMVRAIMQHLRLRGRRDAERRQAVARIIGHGQDHPARPRAPRHEQAIAPPQFGRIAFGRQQELCIMYHRHLAPMPAWGEIGEAGQRPAPRRNGQDHLLPELASAITLRHRCDRGEARRPVGASGQQQPHVPSRRRGPRHRQRVQFAQQPIRDPMNPVGLPRIEFAVEEQARPVGSRTVSEERIAGKGLQSHIPA